MGGAGADAIEVSGALAVTGALTVTPGDGENTFTSNLFGSGTNTIGGSFNYLAGPTATRCRWTPPSVGRGVTVALGESFGSGVAPSRPGCTGPGR